jgi:Domain of unknown function (DUF6371)
MSVGLEKYRGTKSRHTCPSCRARNCFVRYVSDDGNYLSDTVGRCNRESKCGYHYKPKEFFADNPQNKPKHNKRKVRKHYGFASRKTESTEIKATIAKKTPDYIPYELFKRTLGNYDQNSFVHFLRILFPDNLEAVQSTLKRYFIGTYEDYICFPYIDKQNRVCKAKLIRYDHATGKRLKGDFHTSSLSAKLGLGRNYKQTFFGEHLLRNSDKPVAIVESEKSALIGSICLPEYEWLAIGSKQSLKVEKIARLPRRDIILYPDADGFELWQEIALKACQKGLAVNVSNLIEKNATSAQKAEGFDLADYLIDEQIDRLERYNEFVDRYNAKLEKVLNSQDLLTDVETILEERKSILMIEGELSDIESEVQIRDAEYLREIVMSVR